MSDQDDSIGDRLLNMVLDEVDDILIFQDDNHSIIWMNRAAQKKLNVVPDKVIGTSCFRLFGCTCRCKDCEADRTIGGPCRSCCCLTVPGSTEKYKCTPVPYHKDGKLVMVVQHLRVCADENE